MIEVIRGLMLVLLMLAAPFLAIAALAALFPTYLYISSQIIPAKSADVFLPEIETTVRLQFYYTWGDESGRFLTVTNRNGTVRSSIDGWDWAHHVRTSIYITSEGNVAILGQAHSDYIVDSRTLRLRDLLQDYGSSTWKYVGAFDSGRNLSLHFFATSDQRECIPMLMEYGHDRSLPRDEYRRPSCHGSELTNQ